MSSVISYQIQIAKSTKELHLNTFLSEFVLFSFTFADVTDPTASCPDDITTVANLKGETTARVDFVPACSDNIDTGIQADCNATNQTDFSVGETTVNCSCRDLSQNTDECSFTVTVKDVTDPTASCPDDITTVANLKGETTARVDFVPACSDNIDTGIQADCNATNQTDFSVGETTVNCSCRDLSQNTDECSFTVTVKDVTDPTASCPDDITTVANLKGETTARVDFVPACSDNIDTGIQADCNATNQTDFSVGETTVNCSCRDLSQNTDECSFTVTVKDVTDPTASCPDDITTVANLKGETTARVDFVPACSDNIDTGIQADCNATNQTDFSVGETTVNCSCRDLSQNTDECSFTVTVKDVTDPTASCPDDITTVANLKGETTARVDFVPACSDNIDTGIQADCNATNQTDFSVGETTVNCSCRDLSQNTDECSFTVTVKDVTDPTASCPDDITTVANLKGETTARVDFVPACSDNIDTGIQADCNATNQTDFSVGETTVNCSCRDLSQNTDECSFTVTVKDVTDPTASCPDDITTVANLKGETTARVDFVPACSDNIDTGIQADCNATNQTDFSVGETTVNCSCRDLSQNTDECSFTVTVKDVTDPTASCPDDITTVANLKGETTARVDFVPACSDNIDTGIQADCNATNQTDFSVGETTVNCSCRDLSQNTDECSFTVTVKDVTDPTARCPDNITTVANLQGETIARVDFVPACSDNIDTGIEAACNATNQTDFSVGVTTVNCSCRDFSQNTDECSFSVTVKDVSHLTASCPNDINTDANLQEGTTARVDFVASCSDNSDTGIEAACNATNQTEFSVGVTTVNCSCRDFSQNTDECSFTITVKDVTHPTASCPNDINSAANLHRGTTARVDFFTLCSDNIDTGIEAACNATNQTEFSVGVTTVNCSCRDFSQNTDECSFTVTVKDVTHPTASCPDDIDTDANMQEGTIARVDFVPACSDNIDTGIEAACNATNQTEFSVGVTTVNCSCRDFSQNTDECSFTVTVKDVTHPTASCPNDINTDANRQEGTTARVDFVPSCFDNIDTGIQAACNATSQSEFPVGATTVTCSCEDLSQNTDECSFTVTVKDVTHPTASCPHNIDNGVRLQKGNTARVDFLASCSDNIDTDIQASCNATSQSEFPVGVTTVTCSCKDLSQNTDECSFTITVKDPPKIQEELMEKKFYPLKLGKSFDLSCDAKNADSISWTRVGTNKPVSGGKELIFNVSFVNQGSYVCTAIGTTTVKSEPQVLVISDYLKFTLSVFNQPIDPTINSTLVNEGYHVTQAADSSKSFIYKKRSTDEVDYNVVHNLTQILDKWEDWNITINSYCKEGSVDTDYGRIEFPNTFLGINANSSQMSLTSDRSQATCRCNGDTFTEAVWDDPVIVQVQDDGAANDRARYQTLNETLRTLNVTTDNAFYVAEVLVNLTTSSFIETENFDIVAQGLGKVSNANDTSAEVSVAVVNTIDNVVQATSSNEDSNFNISQEASSEILQAFSHQLDNVGNSGKNFSHKTPNIAATVAQIDISISATVEYKLPFGDGKDRNVDEEFDTQTKVVLTPSLQKATQETTDEVKTSIKVPHEVGRRISEDSNNVSQVTVALVFTVHRTAALFQDPTRRTEKVNSLIISASPTTDIQIKDLPDNSNIETTSHPRKSFWCKETRCAYWNTTDKGWADDGSKTVGGLDYGSYRCKYSHLTNFAVLVDVHGSIESKALDIFSIIGCIISVIGLIVIIITYLSSKKLRSNRPKQIILNLSISLLGLYFCFVIGINQTRRKGICVSFGALTHFFLLASVTWMSIEAANMYLLFVKVFNSTIRNFLLKACAIGWGVPAVIVIACVSCSPDSYASCDYCFPRSQSLVFLIFVFGLVAFLILYNFIIFILVITKLTCGRKKVAKIDNKGREMLRRFQNAMVIAVLLGMTWIFGYVSILGLKTLSNILFCIFNSLQGFCIFVFFGVRQNDVRAIWVGWLRVCRTRTSFETSSMSIGLPSSSKGKLSALIKSTSATASKVEVSEMKSWKDDSEYFEIAQDACAYQGIPLRSDQENEKTTNSHGQTENSYERVLHVHDNQARGDDPDQSTLLIIFEETPNNQIEKEVVDSGEYQQFSDVTPEYFEVEKVRKGYEGNVSEADIEPGGTQNLYSPEIQTQGVPSIPDLVKDQEPLYQTTIAIDDHKEGKTNNEGSGYEFVDFNTTALVQAAPLRPTSAYGEVANVTKEINDTVVVKATSVVEKEE
ncbi:uncharacterized protein [Apostichopus japonicus]|uniref:uncharacterized protein isoform X3 n=1 Tax=Stichopus japonicus TaxID=307972 RepID=UPI003AB1AA06